MPPPPWTCPNLAFSRGGLSRSWSGTRKVRAAPGNPSRQPLRPGNAGSNTAADHITATRLAPAQLPKRYRRRQTLIRTDSAGHPRLRRLARPAGQSAVLLRRHGDHRRDPPPRTEGPRVCLAPGRRGGRRDPRTSPGRRTHRRCPGRQAEGDAADRQEGTAASGRSVEADRRGRPTTHLLCHRHHRPADRRTRLRHRLRARTEDRIRAARWTGLRNLPLKHTAQNRIWLEIAQIRVARPRFAWPAFSSIVIDKAARCSTALRPAASWTRSLDPCSSPSAPVSP